MTFLNASESRIDKSSAVVHYVALQGSNVGHSRYSLLEGAMENHLWSLFQAGRYPNVLECLANVVVLWLQTGEDGQQELRNDDCFKKVIRGLLDADKGILSKATGLLGSFEPGSVSKDFKRMIAKQIVSWQR